ncbi:MAG: ABC transporter substrate-binding protein [Ilumatobacteraceae bacterium]
MHDFDANPGRPPLSRRTLLGLGAATVTGLVLAACGSDGDASSTAASTTSAAPGTTAATTTTSGAGTTSAAATTTTAASTPASAPAALTRTVDTIHGAVEVPTSPQRVVCLNFVDTATMLDVGIVPVGMATSGVNFLPEYESAMANIPQVTSENALEYQVELIASLKPDLIIGSDWLAADRQHVPYDQLSAIAPTAICEWQQAAGNWPDQAAFFADVVGRTSELDALRSAYEAHADQIKSTHAAPLGEYTWALIQGGLQSDWYLYTPHSSHGQVFARAGVRFADIASDETGGFVAMSTERIGDLAAADVLALNVNVSATAGADKLKAEALYQTLPAVKNDRVFGMSWFFPSSYKVADALLGELDTALGKLA